MQEVVITYVSGEKVGFEAQEFDIDITGSPQTHPGSIYKFTYKGVDGNDTPIYLTPKAVEGIVVVPKRKRA